jgi:hypothetical protein
MNRKIKIRNSASLMAVALLAIAALYVPMTWAQAPARFVGAVTAINGTTLTVKTDAGQTYQVDVPASASIKRIAPGQKDLSTATAVQFSELAVGDRALIKLDPDAPAGTTQALQIVAMKQSDVAQKQQKDREDWQRRGVGGLVKSVDVGSGVIVLASGSGANAKTITVNTTKTTVLKRYATASVNYDAAQPAPIDAIHPGDQLRARGSKNADGTSIAAEEVVSGTFRNLSGTIASLDTSSSTFVVKDLTTKKQITVHITPDAQMRRLPDRMAAMLAARLKGASGSGGGGGFSANAPSATSGATSTQRGAPGQYSGSGGQAGNQAAGQGGGQWPGQGGGPGGPGGGGPGGGAGAGGGDPQQMLSRAPQIQFADLKKGDAIMVVSTDGTTDVTAITLLAGVEPLLEAPAASQNLLNNWSMGSGGAEAAAAQ